MDGSNGHRVAKDELLALGYISFIKFEAGAADVEAVIYLHRILAEVRSVKARFVAAEDDPEGFGAATFGELIGFLGAMLRRAGPS